MRRIPRHGSFARCCHRRCPTLLPLKTALLLQPHRLHLQPSWNPNMIPRAVPLEKVLCISPLPPMLEIAVHWHTPTVGIEPTASPSSHSAVGHTNHCATAPFPKRMVWTQLRPILCAVYRDTVLSPDVTTIAAQHHELLRYYIISLFLSYKAYFGCLCLIIDYFKVYCFIVYHKLLAI